MNGFVCCRRRYVSGCYKKTEKIHEFSVVCAYNVGLGSASFCIV